MASWYIEQRQARDREGRQRRREAWLALGLICSLYAAVWAWKGFFG